jgi:hypothetical protein
VKTGDTIKIDGKTVTVRSVHRTWSGDVNVRYEGQGGGGQESFDPNQRAN